MSEWWESSSNPNQDPQNQTPEQEPSESTENRDTAPDPTVTAAPDPVALDPTAPSVPPVTPPASAESGWTSPTQSTEPGDTPPRETPASAPQPPAYSSPYQWDPQRPIYSSPANRSYSYGSKVPAPPQKPRKKGNGVWIALVAILGALCLVSVGITGVLVAEHVISSSRTPSGAVDTPATSRRDNASGPTVSIVDTEVKDGGLPTSEIVQNNLDSTVVINMYRNTSVSYGGFQIGQEGERRAGQASGIVMSEDGYIITNQHVVFDSELNQEYSRIEVEMYNGTLYNAEVIGSDVDTDLAVIKIDATGLKPATFGNSDNANLGDRVVTLGNAGGLPWSVSQGILSGTHRDVYDKTGYSIQCLQVDAPINPGNSGGPLFNSMGEVIGVNSAKIVYEGYESLGFSIPINEAKPVIDDLIRYGRVTGRIELGITGYTVTQTGYEGFMIATIENNSSLAGTDVQVNDIITHVDGTRVTGRVALRNELSKHKAGDTVTLTLLRIVNNRTGQTMEYTVTVQLQATQG